MKKINLAAAILLVLTMHRPALASGMLIPKDKSIPPLAIKHQRVDIAIKDGTATAKIEQVFRNSTSRDLEATYVFPLPENASIAEFAMYINGKRMSGELVEKNEARRIYEDIVRRMKDPGLLEHIGGNLFRVRVYPVPKNGEQKIEISYSETLDFDSGLYRYVYPLKTSEQASRTLDDFSVRVSLTSALPIKNVYSPSHKVGISRKGEHRAVIGLEQDKALLDRDFVLYYGVSKKEFGLNLLTHATKGNDGFFMMMLSPSVTPKKANIINRDITFVFDSSGSMAGDKIKQAREALKYCVTRLNDGDRVNIVRFSTDVEMLSKEPLAVSARTRKKAMAFIEDIDAIGGTDICSALSAALSQPSDKTRPHIVVFLTDGKPTIGDTDTDTILTKIAKATAKRTRIFVFGVGSSLNTHLLDQISGNNGGISQYVPPEEDIELKVSSFHNKMSHPVLSTPTLEVDTLTVRMLHPKALPDMFAGSQVILFGRYAGHGDHAIRLSGEVNGKNHEFVYEGSFPKATGDNEFIPRLWATRRVGYLLDHIRLHGEGKELKDEVTRLGKEFGIMTPYTSYLVLENDAAYKTHGIARTDTSAPAPKRDVPVETLWTGKRQAQDSAAKTAHAAPISVPLFGSSGRGSVSSSMEESSAARPRPRAVRGYMNKEDGADAVTLSQAVHDYKHAERADRQVSLAVRHVGRKIFYLLDGIWTDRDYSKEMKSVKLKYASDEYFRLLAKTPGLKKYLALGEKVIVCLDDNTAVIIE